MWARSGQFQKGREFFDRALHSEPDNQALRIEYGNLLLRAGDSPGAEREWRTILEKDPSNESALEELVNLWLHERKPAAAIEVSWQVARSQSKNYRNNVRLAEAFVAQGDHEKAIDYLRAMIASGPAPAAAHFELARQWHALGRDDEMLMSLAQAKRIAGAEENTELLRAIGEMLDNNYHRR